MNNIIAKYKIDLNTIESAHWKTQDSDENSILFYYISDDLPETIRLFEQRIEQSNYKVCVTNRQVEHCNVVVVKDVEWLPIQEEVCDYFYPYPKTRSICITGTNGKTTTIDLLRQCLLLLNKKVLTIGTLGVWKNEKQVEDFGLTSPNYIDFRKYFHQYGQDIDCLAVEISSHALEQKRYFNYQFDIGAWTSFSQDHLDYHQTMDSYFEAKSLIFKSVKEGVCISNEDVEIIEKLKKQKVIKTQSCKRIDNDFLKISYNKKNLSLALKCLELTNFDTKEIDISLIKAPPGRFNIIQYKEGHVIIDFAHTPEAIENICREIKTTFNGKKLITVFGCGGDRDKTKRPLMGKSASLYSDYLYITSDNPRTEDPMEILKNIEVGVTIEYKLLLDRKLAIKEAMLHWQDQIILIAGKGHENYIDQNGVKRPYSDQEVVYEVINDKV